MPGGPNMLGATNFWKKLAAWGNFFGQKSPNTTTVSGASGLHMRHCKRLTQIFWVGVREQGYLLGRQKWALSSKIDTRLDFMLDRKKISVIKASGSRRGLPGLTPQLQTHSLLRQPQQTMSSKTVGRADLVSNSRTQLPQVTPEVASTASGVFVVKRNRRAARVPRAY